MAPLGVALVSFIIERGIFSRLYEREHIMLFLLTFSLALVFGDLVKMVWGADYRSVPMPRFFQGSILIFGLPFPIYNFFLLLIGPVVAILAHGGVALFHGKILPGWPGEFMLRRNAD